MSSSSVLGTLVVRIAAEIRKYQADLATAARDTEAAAGKIGKSSDLASAAAARMGGGMGEAARAAQGLHAAAGGAGLGVAALAAGAAAAGYAAYKGAQEQRAYEKSLVMSGNAAGVTAGQLADMAAGIDRVVGTQAQASAALVQMAASGKVAGDNLQKFSTVALELERTAGQSVGDTVKHFAQLGDEPVKASIKLNESLNYLTASTFEQIKAAQDLGDHERAANLAQNAYADAMKTRAVQLEQNAGLIEKSWRAVRDVAKEAWDAMLGIGRQTTASEQLTAIQSKIDALKFSQAQGFGLSGSGKIAAAETERQIRQLEAQAAALGGVAHAATEAAKAQAEKAAKDKAAIQWMQEGNQYLDRAAKLNQKIVEITIEGVKAGASQAEIERRIAIERERAAEKGSKAAKAALSDAERLAKAGEKLAASLLAQEQGLSGDFAQKWEQLGAAYKAGAISLDVLVQAQARLLAQQPGIKAATEAMDKANLSAAQAHEKYVESLGKGLAKIEEEIAQQRLHNAEIGLGKDAVAELTAARLEDQAAMLEGRAIKQMDKNLDQVQYELLMAQARALRELAALKREGGAAQVALDEAKEAQKAWEKAAGQIEQSLSDALMNAFTAGKGFGQTFVNSIKAMFNTMVLRPVISAIVRPVAGTLTSAMGFSGAANAATGGNIVSAGSSIYSALTTGVSSSITAGFAKLAGSSFGQSIGLSNSSAIMGNNPSAFVPAGGQLTPLGQSIGTVLGMAGNALAGYGISSAISNGYTTAGNTVNVIAGIASAIWGPIAGVVGGLINRAFGRKLKDTGIEGTIGGAAGFEGNSYQFYKGGWFRSDKTVRGELDAGVDKSLDTAVKQMQLSMAGLAMSIGAPTEAISSFSQAIKLSFNGLDEAGIQEKITQTLADYNEGLASAFIASVDRSELPKWVDRLMGNVDASVVERLQAIADYPAKLLQSFGTSRDQLAQLYAEGLARGDTTAAGQAVADNLVASIEASMLGNASAQVFDIVNQGIVTPMLDAIVLGQNVSEALSQASIQKTIERAKETAAAFAELWNNAEFTAALEDIRTTVGGALGNAGTALDYIPRYTQAVFGQLGQAMSVFGQLGQAMSGFAAISDDGKARLVAASGGIDALATAAGAYYDAMYTEDEKRATTVRQYTAALQAVNQAVPTSIEGYRQQVSYLESIASTEPAAAAALAVMYQVGPAFASVNQPVATLKDAMDALRSPIRSIQDIAQSLFALEKEGASLQVELLKTYGDEASLRAAAEMQRGIETANMTAQEIAQYDLNAQRRAEIDAIHAQRQAIADGVASWEAYFDLFGSVEEKQSRAKARVQAVLPADVDTVQEYKDWVWQLTEQFGVGSAEVKKATDVARDFAAAFPAVSETIAAASTALTTDLSAYYAALFTPAEQVGYATGVMAQKFADLGLTMPTTVQGFKDLVAGLDTTTEAGRVAYNTVVGLAGAWKDLQPAVAAAVTATTDLSAYHAAYFTEAERAGLATTSLTATLAAVGLALPTTRDGFRALVEAQDLNTESGIRTYNTLIGVAGAFADLVPAATEGAAAVETLDDILKGLRNPVRTLEQIAGNIVSLEEELFQAQNAGNTQALRDHILAGLTPDEQKLKKAIWAIEDYNQSVVDSAAAAQTAADEQRQAAEALAAAAQKIASEHDGLWRQWLQASGDTAALRALELAALDPSNRALQEQIWALEDQQAAADEAAAAAEQMKSAWASLTDSITDEVRRIRGLVDDGSGASYASLAAQFAVATAQTRAGDQDAARLLPGLSQGMLSAYEATAASLVDLQRVRAMTANSLETTASLVGGVTPDGYATGSGAIGAALSAQSQAATAQTTELQGLRAEVAALRTALEAVVVNTGKGARLAQKWDDVGIPVTNTADGTPLSVA